MDQLSRLMIFSSLLSLAGALYIIGVAVYRLTLHPLAKYPGPLLGKITDWYIVFRSLVGDRHIHLLSLHETHGPFVRFGPNRLSVNTAEGLQKIYGLQANTKKSSYYNVSADVFKGENVLTTIDNEAHSRKRKVFGAALSDRSVRSMEGTVLKHIRKFIQRLGEADSSTSSELNSGDWSSPKNMIHWASYFAFDVMGDICFSNSLDTLDKPDHRYLLDALPQGVNAINVGGWMPAIFRLHLGDILFVKAAKGLNCFLAFSAQQSATRIGLGDKISTPDVFSHLIRANRKTASEESKIMFSPEDLMGEASLLIIAGSDTTAITITTSTFYLLHNPEKYEKLKNEVRSRFDALEDIRSGSSLNSCRWLRACIDEALRMSPPIPGILPREVLPAGVSIGGHAFPGGVEIGVTHYALHHNEKYYPDSFAYKPERWLTDALEGETKEQSEERLSLAYSAFCPFSIGPRGCVGKTFAMKEVMITVARIAWLFDMRLVPGKEDCGAGGPGKGFGRHRSGEQQIIDMFVSKVDGPIVQFRRRIQPT